MLRQLTRALTTKAVKEQLDAVLYYITRELDPYVREMGNNLNAYSAELTDPTTGDGVLKFGGIWFATGTGAPGTGFTVDAPVGSLYVDKATGTYYLRLP